MANPHPSSPASGPRRTPSYLARSVICVRCEGGKLLRRIPFAAFGSPEEKSGTVAVLARLS
eukprot:3491334-Alexandrium_andersonii.AAC.1